MKPFNYKTVLFEFKTKCLVRLLFVCVICSLFNGCIIIKKYPEEWPQILTIAENKCPNISGVYKNKALKKAKVLGNVFIEQFNGKRYSTESDIVTILQTDTFIEVSVHRTDEIISIYPNANLIGKRKLIFNKDIFCKEKQIIFTDSGLLYENVAGYESYHYFFQVAEDGSLIMHEESSAAGLLMGLVPIAGYSNAYYLFEKYIPSKP